ncbi:MerR family transcriptional regulator [Kineococcus sp. SYSU DK003]|uniref:MerR family transcriptional regulator n=1 Tax=Kineococcus sp. SYSU DK003 TaxID=3383124 RepID=UPI003D7E1417
MADGVREWTIHEVAKATGTTSRTLRHYADVGLLTPSRTGAGGYRYYDEAGLRRLQRILLLRDLGLGLQAIGDVLAARVEEEAALATHLELLQAEAARIGRLVESVRTTLEKTRRGQELEMGEMFDGFDGSEHEEEVVQRWGREAYEDGQRTWRELGEDGRRAHLAEHEAIGSALAAAAARGDAVEDDAVQELVRRHHAWVSRFWTPDASAYRGLVQTYVDDERFRATYDGFGPGTAQFLRRAADVFAQRALS